MEKIGKILAVDVRKVLFQSQLEFFKLQEIRLRVDSPLLIVYEGKEHFLDRKGMLTQKKEQAFVVSHEHVQETMEYISNYSMYAFAEEMKQGYITIRGGHRIGIAGKMIWERNGQKNLTHISCLNIRLAHQVIGCADRVMPYLFEKKDFCHTLIISPPGCGKTTLLRDLIRQLSDGSCYCTGKTVGVVDERSELGACYLGQPQNDLGCRTDILDACPKADGMMMLVRSMAPKIIAVDEIGSGRDVEAMEYVMNCGVRLLATVHGNTVEEIKNKPVLGRLVRERIFQRYIVLMPDKTGGIQAVFDERGTILLSERNMKKVSEQKAC
ncbi:MAG: stage III sporulation protein AA [Butyribacter sp.]|nr:stage III sporulation protein AA [bacterium]MDY3854373.1 stage III sporulation protein AA [Butyribacter sp.]